MDINEVDEVITVTKLSMENQQGYLMIAWQINSFEMYLYLEGKLWKGFFACNRLASFSNNLQIPESDYYKRLRRCLSQDRDDYVYELKNGFFYWKLKVNDALVTEGFLPLEIDTSSRNVQPDLIEVLIVLNKQLKEKAFALQTRYQTIKSQYQQCLRDTEEFLGLKMEMEKTLCDNFLGLINSQAADGEKNNEINKHITM